MFRRAGRLRVHTLDSRSDIAQTFTLAPRYDFFPWVGMGQINNTTFAPLESRVRKLSAFREGRFGAP